jgi:hypothetical protein
MPETERGSGQHGLLLSYGVNLTTALSGTGHALPLQAVLRVSR